jgi:hypothetical protein
MSYDDIDDLFSAGGGPATAKLSRPGDTAEGIIYKMDRLAETDDDGNVVMDPRTNKPKPLLVFHLITKQRNPEVEDDDGTRRLWAKGNLLWSIQNALREQGLKPRLGGMLRSRVDSLKPNTNPKRKPMKQHVSQYWAPTTETEAQAFAMAARKTRRVEDTDELFGNPPAQMAQQQPKTSAPTLDSMRSSDGFDSDEPPF